MESPIRRLPVARIAGAAGITAQLASAYWFVLYPALSVPSPANYVFVAAWFVLVGLTFLWWRSHPLRSAIVPVVSVPIAVLALELGTRFLGWAP